jgi:hypothetical protein
MEEELWRLGQQFRVLRELRDDIRGVWDDAAARDINSRQLTPHDEESEQLMHAFRGQKEALAMAQSALFQAETYAVTARGHAMKVLEQHRLANEQTAPAYHEYEQCMNYEGMAQQDFTQVARLLQMADCAC